MQELWDRHGSGSSVGRALDMLSGGQGFKPLPGPCRPLLFEHVCWCFFGRVVQSSWLNAKEIPIHQKQFSGNTSHSLCTPPGRKSVKTLIFIKLQFPAGKSVKIFILIKLQFPAQTKSYRIKIGASFDFLIHFSIFLLEILNIKNRRKDQSCSYLDSSFLA